MATFNVQLNSRSRRDGRHLIMIRVTADRKHKYYSIQKYVRKHDFNPHAKYGVWIRTSHPDHKLLNDTIKVRLREMENSDTDHAMTGPNKTNNSVAQPETNKSLSFSAFAKKEIERHKAKGQFRIAVKKTYLINKMFESADGQEVDIQDITVTFLKAYEQYWSEKGNRINTLHTDLKGIRSIVNSAINEGLFPSELNPFRQFKLRTERTIRTKLTEEEIGKLEVLDLSPNSKEWNARNMFLFSFYCAGVRFGDLLQLKWKNIQTDHLSYVMDKNGDPHQVLIGDKALKLLQLYRTNRQCSPDDFIFPFLETRIDYSDYDFMISQISSKNTMINSCLKKIAIKAGINKPLSFHISRHTFAYLAIRKTGDLYGVSKSLNHKRIDTTQVYLKNNDPEATDSIMRRVFDGAPKGQ